MIERTLSLIKPDAIKRNLSGKINAIIEERGLKIIAQKMMKLTDFEARKFYKEHEGKPFFESLVKFMTSGRVVAQVLYGEDAIARYIRIIGKTTFIEADEGTIRRMFATSIQENCVHGSDSKESAEREIHFFFAEKDIFCD